MPKSVNGALSALYSYVPDISSHFLLHTVVTNDVKVYVFLAAIHL